MQLRKLSKEEHGKTRALWEKVFSEDSQGFLDYYYFIKTQDNKIYVLEEDGEIRSMVQMNPYTLQIEDSQFLCHYVVGVATQKEYRSRGYFGDVFRRTLADMYASKEPFTFLMPAAKEIYLPYGFRFIYEQKRAEMIGSEEGDFSVKCKEARLSDAEKMAVFFDEWKNSLPIEKQMQVYAVRDTKYYQTKLLEQQSEDGGIRLVYVDKQLIGMFAYYEGEEPEIWEPIFLPEYETAFLQAIYELTEDAEITAKCYGYMLENLELNVKNTEDYPIIMARILHLESLFKCMKVREGEQINCSFAVLDPLLVPNNKVWKLLNEEDSCNLQVCETEDSQGVITIEALTEYLFGQKSLDEIEDEEYVILTKELKRELQKLQVLERVFLNEIV